MQFASCLCAPAQSFTGFTIFFFILELVALVLAFRSSFFTHVGNLVDLAVVGLCLYAEVNGESRGAPTIAPKGPLMFFVAL